MYRPQDEKERILHRLKIARGHLNKVMQMIEDDEYCIDVLHQSQAVQQALRQTDTVLMEHHLSTCMLDSLKNGKSGEAIEEMMTILKKRG
jgi:CsoR family transcriptional regulator, copper-sensing transcriptional repressor